MIGLILILLGAWMIARAFRRRRRHLIVIQLITCRRPPAGLPLSPHRLQPVRVSALPASAPDTISHPTKKEPDT